MQVDINSNNSNLNSCAKCALFQLKIDVSAFSTKPTIYIVGWEQNRPIFARCVKTSHLGSKSTHAAPETGRSYVRRAEIGRSYAPSGDRTFLLPPDDIRKNI